MTQIFIQHCSSHNWSGEQRYLVTGGGHVNHEGDHKVAVAESRVILGKSLIKS